MAHITTPAGTDLYMEMNDMEPIIECGIARNRAMRWHGPTVRSPSPCDRHDPRQAGHRRPICYYGCPTIPVELRIEKGRIVEVVGGDAKICKEIRRQIAQVKDSDNIAEIGLGLNPACCSTATSRKKKARGTCHIAMGNGYYYGQPPAPPSISTWCSTTHRHLRRGHRPRDPDRQGRQGRLPRR